MASSQPSLGRRAIGRIGWQTSRLLLVATIALAPLLVASVHRPALSIVCALAVLALLCLLAGAGVRGPAFRGVRFALPLLLLLALPLAQSVPLPVSLRTILDPNGAELLTNLPPGTEAFRFFPMSLDPAATLAETARAGAALAIFFVALNIAGRERDRMLVPRVLALLGAVVLAVGLGHRLARVDRIYGEFAMGGGLLGAPFINGNHAAEFFELCAFAALATVFDAAPSRRALWAALAALSAGGAIATLSRGALLGLLVGAAAFLWLRPQDDQSQQGSRHRAILWIVVALLGAVAFVFAIDAVSVITKELSDVDLRREKHRVWLDALPIVVAHPLGIGRHAFERVYPVYRTLPGWRIFEFVENGPLELLINVGWLGFGVLSVAGGVVLTRLRKLRRKDVIEAALAAGLLSVLVHNLVDFGLETAGVRLPFVALLGALIGRALPRETTRGVPRSAATTTGFAVVGVTVGLAAMWSPIGRDFGSLISTASSSAERREMAIEGARVHPTDYFFPLMQGMYSTLAPGSDGRSPRLAAFNRALRLCPNCAEVHRETARSLWGLGRRGQALLAWRRTAASASELLPEIIAELERVGARPSEIATLASGQVNANFMIAERLVVMKAPAELADVLAPLEADPRHRFRALLLRAELALTLGNVVEAEKLLASSQAIREDSARLRYLRALLAEQNGNLDKARDLAAEGSALYPTDVPLARKLVDLVVLAKRWTELEPALDRFRIAVRVSGTRAVEANFVAAQAYQQRGNIERAVAEYEIAERIETGNYSIKLTLAYLAEQAGNLRLAEREFTAVMKADPNNPDVVNALRRVQEARRKLRGREP